MLSVTDALTRIFDLIPAPETEVIPLAEASGRILATAAVASRAQPPFAASAMDGYALRFQDIKSQNTLTVIGEAAAGHGLDSRLSAGQAARIFTGAPVPDGADTVVMQENITRTDAQILIDIKPMEGANIRPMGGDFQIGDTLKAPRVISPSDMALLASMNIANVPVARRPVVALMATGDELVMPGDTPRSDQIIASNSFGLMALAQNYGAEVRMLPIARDNRASLEMAFELAKGADLLITIGGASVGDHDIVAQVAIEMGLKQAFHKIAMRPGKPLMAGQINGALHIGLPGNPVSAMVCGHVFMVPALQAIQGLPSKHRTSHRAKLSQPLRENGVREHYMRAHIADGQISPADSQDSSLLGILSQANALLIRQVNDPVRQIGDLVDYIPI